MRDLSVMASTKTTPRDALVMASILKDMGIIEYEPRVINQMLEFTYRYITNILDDARVFSSHAKKKSVDVEDVKLAIQMQMDKSFTTPPPRDILIDIARQRNNMPLPLIKPHCGPRLPPDRYCLSACNYHMKAAKKSRQHGAFTSISAPKINLSSVAPKLNPAINLASKSGSTLSLVGKGLAPPTVTVVTRPATAATTSTASSASFGGYIPTPIIKSSNSSLSSLTTPTSNSSSSSSSSVTPAVTATVTVSSSVAPKIQTKIQTKVVAGCSVSSGAAISAASTETPIVKMEQSNKRKREDDDYDAE